MVSIHARTVRGTDSATLDVDFNSFGMRCPLTQIQNLDFD